jgi:hypothetical protein
LRVLLPKMKLHIMARRIDQYSWILYCWIAYFVRNADMIELSLHFQHARNNRRGHKLIESQYARLSVHVWELWMPDRSDNMIFSHDYLVILVRISSYFV